MNSEILAEFVDKIVADGGFDGVVVVRNGTVVMDTVVYPFPEGDLHQVYSITKSVVGTLIGIAIDRGVLAGVDVPVVEILTDAVPATVDELKASMTVEDLLTMSSGLACRDSFLYEWQGLAEMQASDDWAAHVLALPMSEEPGTKFEYCNGASMLLSAILSEVTGMSASEFATDVLFDPLGISDFSWPASPDGVTLGWVGLMMSPADLAKVGLLYLRDGKWDGDQVVSSAWIDAATRAQIDPGFTDGYGYQWWVDAGYPFANGYGGQFIFVIPDLDLVVVFVAGLPQERVPESLALATDYVVRAVVSDSALPANADAQARLSRAVTAAGSEPEVRTPVVSAIADDLDGNRYRARPNGLEIAALEVQFGGGSAVVELEDGSGKSRLEVGLDGRFLINDSPGLSNDFPGEPPMALRGTWQSDDTFLVEYQSIGANRRGTWEFTFDDGSVLVLMKDSVFGTFIAFTGDLVD